MRSIAVEVVHFLSLYVRYCGIIFENLFIDCNVIYSHSIMYVRHIIKDEFNDELNVFKKINQFLVK